MSDKADRSFSKRLLDEQARRGFQGVSNEDEPLRPGDWVRIYAQVAENEGHFHVEDAVVELFSHSDQYTAAVRRDRVDRCAPPSGIARRCTALYRTPKATNDELLHCRLHDHHADRHEAVESAGAPWGWTDEQTTGFMEAK